MSSEHRPGFLKYNIKLMKTICLWPWDSKSPIALVIQVLYAGTMAISLALVSIGQLVEIYISPDVSSMASAVDLATLTSSGLYKMGYIILHRKNFQDIVAKIDANYLETEPGGETVRMSKWLKNSNILSTVYSLSSTFCLFGFFVVIPLLASDIPFLNSIPFEKVVPNKVINTEEKFPMSSNLSKLPPILQDVVETNKKKIFFPLKCWLPFDASWSPLYEFVFLMELYPMIGSGHLYLVSDTFFFMIIYLSCGQLEILKVTLRNLQAKYTTLISEKRVLMKTSSDSPNGGLSPADSFAMDKEIDAFMKNEIKKYVEFHIIILEVVRELDRLLRSMIVADFLHAVISLSFALLQTASANVLYEWVQMLLFIAICILHQFLNNLFGEILIQQQKSLADVVYETPWVEGSSTLKTAVFMTTHQARNTVRLSGWKMYVLGLPTFVDFMKLLVSYYLVLQTLQAEDIKDGKTIGQL